MAKNQFQDEINQACSADGWDSGNDTAAPTSQAMGSGASTVKEKCNAATNEWEQED